MSTISEFDKMPKEIQTIISSFLPVESLGTSSVASKVFQNRMKDGTMWKLAADRMELKNVTKENAKNKLLSLYGAINCIAMICLPEGTQKKLSSIEDTFSLYQELNTAIKADPNAMKRIQEVNDRMLDFIHKFGSDKSKEEIKKLHADPFVLTRKICLYVRESQNSPLRDFTALHYTDQETMPIMRAFSKMGFFNNLPVYTYYHAINGLRCSTDISEVDLLQDIVQAFLKNKDISEKQKKDVICYVLKKPLYLKGTTPFEWEARAILVNAAGVTPPVELIRILMTYVFSAADRLSQNEEPNPEQTVNHLARTLRFFIGKCSLSKAEVMAIVTAEKAKPTNQPIDKGYFELLTKLIDEIYANKSTG